MQLCSRLYSSGQRCHFGSNQLCLCHRYSCSVQPHDVCVQCWLSCVQEDFFELKTSTEVPHGSAATRGTVASHVLPKQAPVR